MTDTNLSPTPDAEAPALAAEAEAPAAEAATSILGNAVAGGEGDPPAPAGDPAPAAEAGGDPVAGAEDAALEATPYEGLTPPDGFAALDTEALTAATPLMRAFNVPDDQAQDFINQAAPILSGMVERATTAAKEATIAQQATIAAEWAAQTKADPEFGGANFDKTVAMSAVILDKFFTKEDREWLTATGLGNYPGLVRGFAKMGAHFAEGEIITGEPAPLTKAHPLYDQRFLPPEQRQA